MLKKFNEMINSSEGSDTKIHIYSEIKKELHKKIVEYNKNTKSNLGLSINNGEINKITIKHKYTNKELLKNNKKLIEILFKNLTAPIKAFEKYSAYFEEEEYKALEKEKEINKNFLLELFELEKFNENIITLEKEDLIKIKEKSDEENLEGDKENILYANSIYQPSFEILKILTTNIELIEEITIEIKSNQKEEERNKYTKVILPLGVGERKKDKDSHLQPTLKNLIKNLYKSDNQIHSMNINIIIKFTRKLNFQEEIIIKNLLIKNGINAQRKKPKIPISITDFDLIMLLSNLKVK